MLIGTVTCQGSHVIILELTIITSRYLVVVLIITEFTEYLSHDKLTQFPTYVVLGWDCNSNKFRKKRKELMDLSNFTDFFRDTHPSFPGRKER